MVVRGRGRIVVEFFVLTQRGNRGLVFLLGFAILVIVFGGIELWVEGKRKYVKEQKSYYFN